MNNNATVREAEMLLQRFERIQKLVNADERLIQRGIHINADLMVHIGDVPLLVSIANGKVLRISKTFPLFQTSTLTLKGSLKAWSELWRVIPRAGWHDIFALTKRGEMSVEGEMHLFFANLQYLKDVLEKPRHQQGN